MTAQRVTNLYDLMDSAYDARAIHEHIRGLGHIPIIDVHPRCDQALKAELRAEQKRCQLLGYRVAEDLRYNERTTVERVNARLKDEFGGRSVRVRGPAKVMCHLMFSIVALAVDQNAGPEEPPRFHLLVGEFCKRLHRFNLPVWKGCMAQWGWLRVEVSHVPKSTWGTRANPRMSLSHDFSG